MMIDREERHRRQQRRVQQAKQQLNDQLRELTEKPGRWREYLDVVSRLPRLSSRDTALVLAQRGTATSLASFDTWVQLGRQVRRGERGIRLIAPVTRADSSESAQKPHVSGWRVTHLFDVSQTDGEELPTPPQPSAHAAPSVPKNLLPHLQQTAHEAGWDVQTTSELSSHGRADAATRTIWLHAADTPQQHTSTLAHELGHALLEHADSDTPRPVREVEAESVAYIVMSHYGVDTSGYSLDYIAGWAASGSNDHQDDPVLAVANSARRVHDCAVNIIDSIDYDPQLAHERDRAAQQLRNRQSTQTAQASGLAQRADLAQARGRTEHTASAFSTTVEHDEGPRSGTPASSQIAAANEAAFAYWAHALTTSEPAQEYLHHRFGGRVDRGPVPMGYAPGGWTSTVDWLREQGHRDDTLLAAGLAQHSKHGSLIDRFSDRIMVPVRDKHATLTGFIGRDISGHAQAKYLNTPGTELFHKGEMLVGLSEQHPRLNAGGTPVIVEGPLDVVAIANSATARDNRLVALAPSGTALTSQQIATIDAAAHPQQPLVVAFDADAAGQAAASRAAEATLDLPRGARIATHPQGQDPADLGLASPDPGQYYRPENTQTASRWLLDSCIAHHTSLFDAPEGYIPAENVDLTLSPEAKVAARDAAASILARLDVHTRADDGLYFAQRINMDPVHVLDAVTEHQKRQTASSGRITDRARSTIPSAVSTGPTAHSLGQRAARLVALQDTPRAAGQPHTGAHLPPTTQGNLIAPLNTKRTEHGR